MDSCSYILPSSLLNKLLYQARLMDTFHVPSGELEEMSTPSPNHPASLCQEQSHPLPHVRPEELLEWEEENALAKT